MEYRTDNWYVDNGYCRVSQLTFDCPMTGSHQRGNCGTCMYSSSAARRLNSENIEHEYCRYSKGS